MPILTKRSLEVVDRTRKDAQEKSDIITFLPTFVCLSITRYVTDLQDEGHYWQTRVLLSLNSCEYSDVCGGTSRQQPDILLKLLN